MDSRIHVCILTSAHPVDDVRVNHKLAQAFLGEGFRVTWVGPDYAYFGSAGDVQSGLAYRLFPRGTGRWGRLAGCLNAYRHGSRVSDVDVFYAPDPDAVVAAVRLARKQGARVIFDVHEVYHQGTMLNRWLRGPMAAIAGGIIRRTMCKTCATCDLVIGVSQAVLAPLAETDMQSMVIRNCAPQWFARGRAADVCNKTRDTLTVMHGKADPWRGTDTILEALNRAHSRLPKLTCIMFDSFLDAAGGFGRESFLKRIAALNLEDVVDLRKGVDHREMPSILRTCDAGLITYGRELGAGSLPNKLFEYMVAGLPVIAPEYSPEVCRILDAEKCGLKADFEDPTAIAEAMIRLLRNPQECREMGTRAREAFEKRHNWEEEVKPLLHRIREWAPRQARASLADPSGSASGSV